MCTHRHSLVNLYKSIKVDTSKNINKGVKTVFFSIGTIVAMNVATVINIYGFPSEAFYGLTSVSLYAIALLVFLVPVALVSAELGAMYAQEGGIYVWVSKAFGYKVGIVATWLQWVQSVFFYPLSLTFAAVTFSYAIPDSVISGYVSNDKFYIITFILVVFWLCTFVGTRGLKHIGRVSFYGVWIGIIIPVFLLIAFGVYYSLSGGHLEMNTEPSALIPHFHNMDQIVMAISIMLFFSGLEVNGAHVYMMKKPSTEYPKALFLTCIIIGIIYILGTLSISTIIPSNKLSITQSVIVAFKNYFTFTGIKFILPVVAAALTFGVVANSLTWITGPASVLKYIASQGYLPNVVQKNNKHGAPIFILISQAIVVTILVCIYALSSKVQQGYQMLLQMTNAIYLTMYAILFVSFIRLRHKDKQTHRPFMAGRNIIVAWTIAAVGLLAAVFSFILCFFPPAQLDISNRGGYIGILFAIYILLILPPITYVLFRKKSKSITLEKEL